MSHINGLSLAHRSDLAQEGPSDQEHIVMLPYSENETGFQAGETLVADFPDGKRQVVKILGRGTQVLTPPLIQFHEIERAGLQSISDVRALAERAPRKLVAVIRFQIVSTVSE